MSTFYFRSFVKIFINNFRAARIISLHLALERASELDAIKKLVYGEKLTKSHERLEQNSSWTNSQFRNYFPNQETHHRSNCDIFSLQQKMKCWNCGGVGRKRNNCLL